MSKVKLCYFLQMLKVLVHNSRFRDYQKLPPLLIVAVLDYLAKFWSTTLDLEICQLQLHWIIYGLPEMTFAHYSYIELFDS